MQNLLGTIFSSAELGDYEYLKAIVDFLDKIIIPLTVVLAVSAALMALVIGIMMAKAESSDKFAEMKKRLIGLIVSVVVIVLLIWVFGYVMSNFATIMNFIRNDIGLFNFS